MAEFSKEYLELNPIFEEFDFSILEIGRKLKKGQSINQCCEGFGITEIINRDGLIYVKSSNPKLSGEFLFSEFLTLYKS